MTERARNRRLRRRGEEVFGILFLVGFLGALGYALLRLFSTRAPWWLIVLALAIGVAGYLVKRAIRRVF